MTTPLERRIIAQLGEWLMRSFCSRAGDHDPSRPPDAPDRILWHQSMADFERAADCLVTLKLIAPVEGKPACFNPLVRFTDARAHIEAMSPDEISLDDVLTGALGLLIDYGEPALPRDMEYHRPHWLFAELTADLVAAGYMTENKNSQVRWTEQVQLAFARTNRLPTSH